MPVGNLQNDRSQRAALESLLDGTSSSLAAKQDATTAAGWAGTGSVARSVEDKLADTAHLFDYVPASQHAAIIAGTSDYDCSADLQAQINALTTVGDTIGVYPTIDLPAGAIQIKDVTWGGRVSLRGSRAGHTKLVYAGSGDGASGSCLLYLNRASAGSIPYAAIERVQLNGWDGVAGHACCEKLIKTGNLFQDWGFSLQNVSFARCWGTALDLMGGDPTKGYFINLFLRHLRFDNVGGWAIELGGITSNSGHPFVLRDFTYDNQISGSFLTQATLQGQYDGGNTQWGRGLLYAKDTKSTTLAIANARIEVNKNLKPTNSVTGIIQVNNTLGGQTHVVLDNISVTAQATQAQDLVHDVNNSVTITGRAVNTSGVAHVFNSPTALERCILRTGPGPFYSAANLQQTTGINLYGRSLGEFRPNPPDNINTIFQTYSAGSIVHNTTLGAGRPVSWICVWPTTGFAVAANATNITTAASCTSGSAVITVPANQFAALAVGLNIVLVGAGAAAADLDCRITAADPTGPSITVSVAPSTTVNPLTIKYDAAEFCPTGYRPGISANKGNANWTATLGVSEPICIVSSALTADRTVTLSPANGATGTSSSLGTITRAVGTIRVVRTSASTGAFNLDVGGLKSLATGQWCDVSWDGAAWSLTGFGSL